MPLYDYRCPNCECRFELFRSIADSDLPETCCCGAVAERQISAPRVRGDIPAYDCPVTGKRIEGRKAHRENLARTGSRVFEPGEREAAARRRKASDEALERSVGDTVEAAIHQMPSRERDYLAAELQSGVSVDLIRQ
jgi:putative FmdB family regulatory protein